MGATACDGTWRGHKYEARYDEIPNALEFNSIRGLSAGQLRELMIRRVYVHDVCVRCGHVIPRENRNAPPK